MSMDKEEQIKWSLESARELMKGKGYGAVIAGLQLASEEIESLRAELAQETEYKLRARDRSEQYERERDEARQEQENWQKLADKAIALNGPLQADREKLRQANAALLKTVSDWRDFCIEKSLDAEAKCYENVINLIAQYDTAQPTKKIKPNHHKCPNTEQIVEIEHGKRCPRCSWLYDVDRNPPSFDPYRGG